MFLCQCPAKINLFLKITGKRDDGFHDIQSLFVFSDLVDNLEVEISDNFKLEIVGEFSQFVDPNKNLLTDILDFFYRKFRISKNLSIKLEKNIPVGAGLGGGSSNAASFMMALNKIFDLNLDKKYLQKISLNFGSDIAFFFENQASIVNGRGEIIENFPNFEPMNALIVSPKIHLSTREIFQKFNGNFSKKLATDFLLKSDVFNLAKSLPNDLELASISTAPVILEIIKTLKENMAFCAKMSGSGSACFAIFIDEKMAINAQKKLNEKFPIFFVRKVKILSRNKVF